MGFGGYYDLKCNFLNDLHILGLPLMAVFRPTRTTPQPGRVTNRSHLHLELAIRGAARRHGPKPKLQRAFGPLTTRRRRAPIAPISLTPTQPRLTGGVMLGEFIITLFDLQKQLRDSVLVFWEK